MTVSPMATGRSGAICAAGILATTIVPPDVGAFYPLLFTVSLWGPPNLLFAVTSTPLLFTAYYYSMGSARPSALRVGPPLPVSSCCLLPLLALETRTGRFRHVDAESGVARLRGGPGKGERCPTVRDALC